MQGPLPVPVPTGPLGLPREAFQKKQALRSKFLVTAKGWNWQAF